MFATARGEDTMPYKGLILKGKVVLITGKYDQHPQNFPCDSTVTVLNS